MGFGSFFKNAWHSVGHGLTKAANWSASKIAVPVYHKVLEPVYNKAIKPVAEKGITVANHVVDNGLKVFDAEANAISGVGNFLGGNPIVTIGLVVVGCIVLSKLLSTAASKR